MKIVILRDYLMYNHAINFYNVDGWIHFDMFINLVDKRNYVVFAQTLSTCFKSLFDFAFLSFFLFICAYRSQFELWVCNFGYFIL
jgi:hypothetical protein